MFGYSISNLALFSKKESVPTTPTFELVAEDVVALRKNIITLCMDIIARINFRVGTNHQYDVLNEFVIGIEIKKVNLLSQSFHKILTKQELKDQLYLLSEVLLSVPTTSKQLAEILPNTIFTKSLDINYLQEHILTIPADMILDINLIVNVGLIEIYKMQLERLFRIFDLVPTSITDRLMELLQQLVLQMNATTQLLEERTQVYSTQHQTLAQLIGALRGVINDLRRGIPIDLIDIPKQLDVISDQAKHQLSQILSEIQTVPVTRIEFDNKDNHSKAKPSQAGF